MTVLDILVVDDDAATRKAVVSAMRMLGHSCRSAADGNEAWAILQSRPADVVISDWKMPGLSGPELCRRTRLANDEGPYTYFILMTGLHDREHLLAGMAAGADDFQKKPIDLDELEARLISASRVVDLHRRLARQREGLRRDSKTFYADSRTDPLTGIGNRLLMNEALDDARLQFERYGRRYTLAMCDLDEFKRFNDAFGHLTGDDALRRVARALRGQLRATDHVFRYGGEEFVVLLPEQTVADGLVILERLRTAVEQLRIPTESGQPLTISSGVAELEERGDSAVAEWLARADRALYEAKAKGRNRIESAGPR